MKFVPPRCANQDCKSHRSTTDTRGGRPPHIVEWGHYSVRCRPERQQRFRCRVCGKTFSRQTFRHDYYDKRPDCNALLFQLLTSGIGLRQCARVLELAPTSAQRKMRKLSRTCALLHENLSRSLPKGRTYLLYEEESHEQASTRPLTVPIVIERDHWFIVATDAGSIRRLAPPGTARRRRQDRNERLHGKRKDQSRTCVARTLRALRQRAGDALTLLTNKKPSYATLARQVFGPAVQHATTRGPAPRTRRNPMFPINVTSATTRDLTGRLRRKSWLASKSATWLRGQLAIFTVFRNYVRQRFNRDKPHQTPAQWLGLLPRQLKPSEAVRWRQDWGVDSPHPLSRSGAAIAQRRAAIA